jgi:site-specific DNA-methyltransferase (adenine-specific)
MAASSVDSVVTDPPYGIDFMGKEWDHGVPGVPFWQEIRRVAKPGAHLLAFGGTRTFHRLTCAIEDAGWEIRDCIMWVYGSGFPKSKDIGNGWGTALKPAWEPIIVARKPLEGTTAKNVLKHGTGGINIDDCRVPIDLEADASQLRTINRNPRTEDISGQVWGLTKNVGDQPTVVHESGRWPSNLIHDGSTEIVKLFPVTSGSTARFFYCAKATRNERDEGLEGFEVKTADPYAQHSGRRMPGGSDRFDGKPAARGKNTHPTVKPVKLMRYLCRLVTPLGGTVLDPFMGSGSTGKATAQEKFSFIGIDNDEEAFGIAKARVGAAYHLLG